jgi:hypothetical protein
MEPNPGANGKPEPMGSAGSWLIPAGVTVAPGIDLTAEDPAAQEGKRRECVALTRRQARCTAPALGDSILCTAHAGKLDQSAGGRARAQQLRLVQEEAETRMVEARLGARAVIAARAIERAADLRDAFDVILDNALAGDKTSARTLLGYLQAAFPDASMGNAPKGEGGELTSMSTEELRALAFTPPASAQG